MESIKRYFRNMLIGLTTTVLTSLQTVNNLPKNNTFVDYSEDDSDVHMFI